jgi:Skp family chaperone for outer membrane proteins
LPAYSSYSAAAPRALPPAADCSAGEMLVTRTRLLVALLVLVVLLQLFPQKAALLKLAAVGAGVIYFAAWGGAKYLAHYRIKSADAAQTAADDIEYGQYQAELEEIRDRYDPDRNADDPAAISPDYRDALSALHDRHQSMLGRKFGPRKPAGPATDGG